jgi:hypothetical protein
MGSNTERIAIAGAFGSPEMGGLRRYCWRTKEEAEEAFCEVKKLASLSPTALREAPVTLA